MVYLRLKGSEEGNGEFFLFPTPVTEAHTGASFPVEKDSLMTDKAELQSLLIKNSKVFCTLPWINLNIDVKGDVYPCWMSPYFRRPIGSVRKSTLEEIWNSKEMRQIRINMLEGSKSPECLDCYTFDDAGMESVRVANHQYFRNIPLLENTEPDGTVRNLGPYKITIQFSNLCHFRCRYCNPITSSAWYHDAQALKEFLPSPRSIQATETSNDLLRQLEPLLPTMSGLSFFGGEPLITDLVYDVLVMLMAKERFDFQLGYTTNFSITNWKGRDIFDLWRRFSDVRVSASLDGMGKRAEYIRKGQKWDQVVRNRERMLKVCPGVDFCLHPTMSVFNVWHFPDFYMDWVDKGYIGPTDIEPNFVLFPEEYRIQILPADFKRQIVQKYERCMQEVSRRYGAAGVRAAEILRAIPQFLNAKDMSDKIPMFQERTQKIDQIRKENCAEVFPELREILA